MPGWRGPELCARVVGLAASDPGGAFAWLDGGDERGWLGRRGGVPAARRLFDKPGETRERLQVLFS